MSIKEGSLYNVSVMKKMLFIAGIGTEVGKTTLTTQLLSVARTQNMPWQGIKPLISGWTEHNSDTHRILEAQGWPITPNTIQAISPWRYTAPISIIQAAEAEGRTHTFSELVQFCQRTFSKIEGTLLIESAGGLMSPITYRETNLDWLMALNCDCILVSRHYLGSIHHTLTSLAALRERGLTPLCIAVHEYSEDMQLLYRGFTNVPLYPMREIYHVVNRHFYSEHSVTG